MSLHVDRGVRHDHLQTSTCVSRSDLRHVENARGPRTVRIEQQTSSNVRMQVLEVVLDERLIRES
jgi:hypothetical protein